MLCELFWTDIEPKKALVNLQTTIYLIPEIVESNDNGQVRIEYAGSNYSLHKALKLRYNANFSAFGIFN